MYLYLVNFEIGIGVCSEGVFYSGFGDLWLHVGLITSINAIRIFFRVWQTLMHFVGSTKAFGAIRSTKRMAFFAFSSNTKGSAALIAYWSGFRFSYL